MFVLVTGGSGSGKSEFAENLAAKCGGDKLYIATMKPYDEECIRRIERHRNMRAGKGFRAAECYSELTKESADTILLECVSNLTANIMFSENNKNAEEKILRSIMALNCKNLIVVTNEISSDGVEYGAETEEYIELLGRVNSELGKRADKVYEVVCKIPVEIK